MTRDEFISTLNQWGQQRVPFLFVIDFEEEKPIACRLADVQPREILYAINGFTNAIPVKKKSPIHLLSSPVPESEYASKFKLVRYHLNYGDSFLTNLTIKTPVTFPGTLEDIFYQSHARYKLLLRNTCLVFSPEIFVRIRDNRIYSYPMKGTIDASIPGAATIILQNRKEEAEHVTIVDLIRNDLSQVATDVRVNRFRYIEELKTSNKNLLQVSSEIEGTLPDDYHGQLGTILMKLLPAGSVSGAPKAKTVAIIRRAEGEKRGYYTGVFGYYDGQQLDSGVMIRYIEKDGDRYYYRSGGGITTQSDCSTEYQETIDKVYVPLD